MATIHSGPDAKFVYKICPDVIWQDAVKANIFKGAGIDLEDGYIHFSTADQVSSTAHLHFNRVEGLVLVKVMVEGLDLTWEESRGEQLFPHLYKDLEMAFVAEVIPMLIDGNGNHIFPPEITPL